jgi:galactokinase
MTPCVDRLKLVTRTFWAPGRVNLIGEHTDYAGGLVLPAAIDLGISIRGTIADDVRLDSTRFSGRAHVTVDGSPRDQVPDWGRFVVSIVRLLAEAGRPPMGFRGTVSSSLPAGAGLASSAALGVAVAITLCAVTDFPLEPMEMAELVQRAEHEAVGVPCGIMDPAASILGRQSHALFLDCATLTHRLVPLPADLAVIILDSGTRRRLEDSSYAARQRELAEAVRASGLTAAELASLGDRTADHIAATSLQKRRLRHFISENRRVRQAVGLLESNANWTGLGALLLESHRSLRDNFEVSTPELDALVNAAISAGAPGARMTGAGFGGSVIALAARQEARSIADKACAAYARLYPGLEPKAHVAGVGDGAGERRG